MISYVVITLAIIATPVFSFSGGAPKTVCSDLTPKHGPVSTQTSPAPYSFVIDNSAKVGKPLNIIIKGNKAEDNIKGFIIQARLNNKPVGKFVPGSKAQTLECDNLDDTLTHQKITTNVNQVDGKWVPDADLKGKTVQFVATVVQKGQTFWVKKLTKNVKIE